MIGIWQAGDCGAVARDILRYQDVIYAQQGPQDGEGGSKPVAAFCKTVLMPGGKVVIGIGHRSVVEVPANYGLDGAGGNMVVDGTDLLATLDIGVRQAFVNAL